MLDGVMLLWFVLAAISLLFVVVDIRTTPASPVLKWGFILLTGYTGPVGAFLYVLGCREPLPGLHERPPVLSRRTSLEGAADNPTHCRHSETPGVAIYGQLEKFSRPRGSRPHTPKLHDQAGLRSASFAPKNTWSPRRFAAFSALAARTRRRIES